MSREEMKKQNKADWASPELFKAGEAQTNGTDLPPLSDADRRRLLREWTDANTRGDDETRRKVEAEIMKPKVAGGAAPADPQVWNIASYPRSGNHLVRAIVEYASGRESVRSFVYD